VEANIQATSIILAGQSKATSPPRATSPYPLRAVLGSRARVEGDVTSKALAIAEGAVFIGSSKHGRVDPPA
jgi:hypothetical protein